MEYSSDMSIAIGVRDLPNKCSFMLGNEIETLSVNVPALTLSHYFCSSAFRPRIRSFPDLPKQSKVQIISKTWLNSEHSL